MPFHFADCTLGPFTVINHSYNYNWVLWVLGNPRTGKAGECSWGPTHPHQIPALSEITLFYPSPSFIPSPSERLQDSGDSRSTQEETPKGKIATWRDRESSTVNGKPHQHEVQSIRPNHRITDSTVLFISLVLTMGRKPRIISYLRKSSYTEDKGKDKQNRQIQQTKQNKNQNRAS